MLTVVVGTPSTITPEAGLPDEPAASAMCGVTAVSELGETNVGIWTSLDPKTIKDLNIHSVLRKKLYIRLSSGYLFALSARGYS